VPTQSLTDHTAHGLVDAYIVDTYDGNKVVGKHITTGDPGAGNGQPRGVFAKYTLWQWPDGRMAVKLESGSFVTVYLMTQVTQKPKFYEDRTRGNGVIWKGAWQDVLFYENNPTADGAGIQFTQSLKTQAWFQFDQPHSEATLAGAAPMNA
jgi:hypothetical protein